MENSVMMEIWTMETDAIIIVKFRIIGNVLGQKEKNLLAGEFLDAEMAFSKFRTFKNAMMETQIMEMVVMIDVVQKMDIDVGQYQIGLVYALLILLEVEMEEENLNQIQ